MNSSSFSRIVGAQPSPSSETLIDHVSKEDVTENGVAMKTTHHQDLKYVRMAGVVQSAFKKHMCIFVHFFIIIVFFFQQK